MHELLIDLDPSLPRQAGLEQALRDAIRTGRLGAGAALPPSRLLATDLGLSRSTVVGAYEQLTVEGYLVARQGSGTRVATGLPFGPESSPNLRADLDREERGGHRSTPSEPRGVNHDLRPGEPDTTAFPRTTWVRALRRVTLDLGPDDLGYGDPRGHPALRQALAEHLGRSRAVSTKPGRVRVFGGTAAALGFLGDTLRGRGATSIAVEDPSLPILRQVLETVGLDVRPVPVDADGIDVDRLADTDADAVLVTPAHHYPLGVTMGAERRAALIEWAGDRSAWIIEDDYDGEFRYDRRKIGALQGLAPDRVVYLGTASKVLAPGLRLSWAAVPPALRGPLDRVTGLRAGVSSIEQLTLADLIDRGDLDRHLRTTRVEYQRRQAAVRQVLEPIPWLEVGTNRAGLHLTATIIDPDAGPGHSPAANANANANANAGPTMSTERIERRLIDEAAACSLRLMGLGPHWCGRASLAGLVIGFSRDPTHRFPGTVERLEAFLTDFALEATATTTAAP